MAVVYFTSNASTGAGSLVEAIANAQPGDVIRPDESVFERGSIIEIVLASALNVDKNLTLDASPFRVRLNGGGTKRGAYVASGVVAEFTAFDFVACYSSTSGGGARVETSARATFNRCLFAGCDSTYGGGLAVQATGNATLNDCAVVGCRATVNFGGGVYASGDVVLNGVTTIGCASPEKSDIYGNANVSLVARNSIVGAVQKSSTATFSAVGSVVGVASSQIGFVAPPDDLNVENWNANAWQNWDLRLLDDASGAPSPYRDSGDVGAMSRYDLDGNFRGRETNGVATCSPGAYETIQADLFWIGRDATGAEVVSPSFLTSDGWAASRFATVAGDVAPQAGQTLFVDGVVSFSDFASTERTRRVGLTVGGGAVVGIVRASTSYLDALQVGACAKLTSSNNITATLPRLGARSWFYGLLTIETYEFEAYENSRIETARVFYGLAPSAPTYGTLTVYTVTGSLARLNGEYTCDVFATLQNGTATGQRIVIGNEGASIRAREFRLGGDAAANYVNNFFDRAVTLKLRGAAVVSTPANALDDWADDFVIDATDATSATLTLNGQTVYGDAPTCAVSLTGSARIDGADSLNVASLTFAEGAKVEFTNDASVILTTASATSATAIGRGAFFAPTSVPAGLTLENGALWCDASAAVTSIDVDPLNATAVKFTVAKTIEETNIVAQYSVDGGSIWSLVDTEAGSNVYELDVPQGADVTVRVATLSGWLSDTVSTAPFLPVWVISNAFESFLGVSNVFEVATGGSNDGLNTYDFNGYGYF